MHFPEFSIVWITSFFLHFATAKVHHLFVGNLGVPKNIYALTFDTATYNLSLTKTITATSAHPWIAFSPDKRNLYGTSFSDGQLSSYSVIDSGNDLHLDAIVKTPTVCKSNDTSAHVVPLPQYNVVYTASWGGNPACYLVTSTFDNGTLSAAGQSGKYTDTSGVHGLALRPGLTNQALYAADTHADIIWTHSILANGKLSAPVAKNVLWDSKAPRHVATHTSGKWLYAVFEAGNSVSAYPITQDGQLGNTTKRFSLLPTVLDTSTSESAPPLDTRWWGAEITVSPSGTLLWATTRAKANSKDPGYISAFLLSPDGEIVERLFTQPTMTKAGVANSISVGAEQDEYVAMTDWKNGLADGYVDVWKVEGLEGLKVEMVGGKWKKVGGNVSMREVARLGINDGGGCCANVVWFD